MAEFLWSLIPTPQGIVNGITETGWLLLTPADYRI